MSTVLLLLLEFCLLLVTAQDRAAEKPDAFCEPNKIFYKCKPCPRSCGNQETPCSKDCQSECYCKEGYVLASPTSNTCIPESECTSCGPNGKYNDCISHCQDTCENYLQQDRPCAMMCKPGCVCVKGYVMHNDQCIRPILCPKITRSFSPIILPLLGNMNITRT
ncbi:hemocytin-like [Bombina bombina]|uniref:hemocytin-like n=1 Tax=Bombina bombina TaxID=8345 RepID=UPI00235AC142|nr:hemocytin-like [Bombina bombina]